ncbi:hypothetical protein BDZ91DRAFT_468464 [Kalaharituber pfeilii]|nr:hypothetical protein BDZ91DRAFT_468464 [Kalaharituber pfeilii]
MRLRSGRLFPPPENSRAPARRARGQTPSRAVRHTALESSEQLPPVASRPRNIAGRKTSTRQARVTPPGQQEETPVQQSQPTDPHTEQQHGSGVQEAAPTQGSLNPEVDNPQVINELDAYNDEITSSANSPRFDRRHQAEQSKERSETTLSPNALQLRAWLASALPQEELLDPFEPMPPGQGPSGIRRQNNPKRQSTAMSDDPVGLSEVFEGDGSSVTGTMLPVSQRQRESNTPENKQYILQNCTPPIVFRYGAPLRPGDVPPKPVLEVSERLDLFKRIKDRPFIPECLRAKLYRREQENGDQGLQIADHKPAATQRMGEAEVQKCWTRIEKLAIKCQKAIESRHPETTWLMHISELFNNEPLTEIFTGKPTHEHIGLAPIHESQPAAHAKRR